jgi:cyclopropane-fatty-acyl-phospholipid synthase
MMEHVGRSHLASYFRTLARALRPGGLFLNHAIADISAGHRLLDWARRPQGSFIERYIFPDSELVPIETVIHEAERAGFEVRDLESLREHYVKTLMEWQRRLLARRAEAEKIVGRAAVRAFRLYLAASAVTFRLGRTSVFQLLLAKRLPTGAVRSLPPSRAAWYERTRASS